MRKQNWETAYRMNAMHDKWIVDERVFKKDIIKNYFYIESLEDDCTITYRGVVEYSIDGIKWESTDSTSTTISSIKSGLKVFFKNISNTGRTFAADKKHNVGGNIMSLLYGDNFENQNELPELAFTYLFLSDSNLLDASKLILPNTTSERCYNYMFSGCSLLVTAPELPATKLKNRCYDNMFASCSSLVNVPKILPATELADYCYYLMFYYCTSLTTAPELPATILTPYCYGNMFYGCTSLNYVKILATDISAQSCTMYWLMSTAPTGTVVVKSTADWEYGSSGIPSEWTKLEL